MDAGGFSRLPTFQVHWLTIPDSDSDSRNTAGHLIHHVMLHFSRPDLAGEKVLGLMTMTSQCFPPRIPFRPGKNPEYQSFGSSKSAQNAPNTVIAAFGTNCSSRGAPPPAVPLTVHPSTHLPICPSVHPHTACSLPQAKIRPINRPFQLRMFIYGVNS